MGLEMNQLNRNKCCCEHGARSPSISACVFHATTGSSYGLSFGLFGNFPKLIKPTQSAVGGYVRANLRRGTLLSAAGHETGMVKQAMGLTPGLRVKMRKAMRSSDRVWLWLCRQLSFLITCNMNDNLNQ